ncbi:enoyl-CoA hydratase [Clostridiaceae bacterium]|nr:enoyl-CoA hydratase [Clostridiaceae bacterium]RKI10769.1 enoyl-CoA hydratase [bacterium 1XD21-70]
MYQYILPSVADGIGTVILNDPPKRNALGQAMASELQQVLADWRFDHKVRTIILRGAEGYFCAGGDITSMKRRADRYAQGLPGETPAKANMDNFNRLILAIRQLEKPVISWIEGACAGGGMSLAMACDFSIADENTKMSFAFVGVGLAPDMGSSLFLTRRVGPARATDLFMTGRRFTGREAEQMNIITRAVPAGELEETVMKQAAQLAAGPALSYREIKASVNRILYPELSSCMDIEADYADRLTHTADHAEAVNAFLEKRKPVFQGR